MRIRKIDNDLEINAICRGYESGLGTREIGEMYHVHAETIARLLKRNGVVMRKKTITESVRKHNRNIAKQQKGRLRGSYRMSRNNV